MDFLPNLAHQNFFLSINPRTLRPFWRANIDHASSAAVLAELFLHERARSTGRTITIVDDRPIGDLTLDTMLRDLASRPPRHPVRIISDPRVAYRELVVADLVANRVLDLSASPKGDRYRILLPEFIDQARDQAEEGLRAPKGRRRPALLGGLLIEQLMGFQLISDLGPGYWHSTRLELRERFWVLEALHLVNAKSSQRDRL